MQVYIKRFRMEVDLLDWNAPPARLPDGYRLAPWQDSLLKVHAEVKFRCFQHELDANVFPSLGDRHGCLRLMTEISQKDGFLRQATWLLAHDVGQRTEYCGTIQGVRDPQGIGSIQNIGITPQHRGNGLGTLLIRRSLIGFRDAGVKRVTLEVTAQNEDAIALYRRLGFSESRLLYKSVEMADL